MITSLRTGYVVLLLTTTTWLTSCSKDDKPAPRTRTELLTGPQWRLTGFVSASTSNGTVTTKNEAIAPCEQDDLLQFSVTPSQTFVIDQGPLVCGSLTDAGYRGRWELASDETILRYNSGTSYQGDEKILTLTDTQLVTFYEGRNNEGPYSQTRTYTAR